MEEKATVRIGISEEIPKNLIFQNVKKRDGAVVPFDKSKISKTLNILRSSSVRASNFFKYNLKERAIDPTTFLKI